MHWALLPLKRYAQFSGRSRRKEYWLFLLLVIGLSIVATALDALLGFTSWIGSTVSGPDMAGGVLAYTGSGPLSLILSLGFLIPMLAVSIRRLHDINRSGWWLLVNIVPLIGSIILLVFFATEGTRGHNRYGPDPKIGW